MKWQDLTTIAVDAFDRKTPVILNISAIEQHGPHLPVNTDATIGHFLLDRLDRIDPNAQLILPQVKVCCSAHHLDFPGTLSVPHSVLHDYVTGILNSVVHAGFRNLLIFNSHGGNQAIGQVIIESFGAANPDCNVAMMTWWALVRAELIKLSETGKFGTGHACELETSLMMAAGVLAPDADIPKGESHVDTFDWANGSMLYPPRGAFFRTMKEISGGSGTIGQPDAASVGKGNAIADLVVNALSQVVADLSCPQGAKTTMENRP